MLRSTLILGLLTTGLLVLGVPAVVGWQLAQYHRDYVQRLSVPGLTEVRESAFSRGLLRSRSRIKLAPAPGLCPPADCPVITIDSTIHHGPIAFTAPPDTQEGLPIGLGVVVSHIDLSPLFAGVQFEPPLPKLEWITRVDWAGGARAKLQIPGARLRVAGQTSGGRLNMEPLQASFTVPVDHDALRGQLGWPDFSLVADTGGQLDWQGLTAQFSGDMDTPLFWRHLGLKLNKLQLVDPGGETLALQGLLWNAANINEIADAARGGHLASEFELRVSQMSLLNRDLGPVILEGQVRGLDIASLEAIQADIRSLNTALPPELLWLAVVGIYQAHAPALLAAGPQISIERFLASTEEGDITADLALGFADQPEAGAELLTVLRRLELVANLRLPEAWFHALLQSQLDARKPDGEIRDPEHDLKQAIEALTEAELVVAKPEENAFVTQIRIENQNLTINGKARELWPDFLQSLARGQSPAALGPGNAVE